MAQLASEINELKIETRNNTNRILVLECEIFNDTMGISNNNEETQGTDQQEPSNNNKNDGYQSDTETIDFNPIIPSKKEGKKKQMQIYKINDSNNTHIKKIIQDLALQVSLLAQDTAIMKSQRNNSPRSKSNMEPLNGSK